MTDSPGSRQVRNDALALCALALLVVLMTWPQVLHLTDGVRDWGDPLLNSWIMRWEVDAVRGGNFAGFFDTNIYYPHTRTLAYSEFLIPQTIVAAPLLFVFDNPVIGYNVALLLSFLATAFAMYLLGRRLTGSSFAGFVGALALAFSPFMFGHLSHIQVIGAAGIPLAFLFLHRYFDRPSLSNLLGFSAAYIVQSLANTHFALYLTYAAAAYILYRAIRDKRLRAPWFYGHMAVHAALSLALLLPFYRQYVLLKSEMGFSRAMEFEARWYSFAAAPDINRLYGTITAPLRRGEAILFPGVVVVLVALFGIWTSRNRLGARHPPSRDECDDAQAPERPGGALSRTPSDPRAPERAGGLPSHMASADPPPAAVRWGYGFAGAVMVVAWLLVIAIPITGGINFTVVGIPVHANDFQNPLLELIAALVARLLLRRRFPVLGRRGPWLAEPQRFYGCLLFVSVVLSLGPGSPYRLLYNWAPGFDSVRAVARIHILSLFCLAVFAAYGAGALTDRLARRGRGWAAGLIPALMLVEFLSIPIPMHEVAWGDRMPAVYTWLADQPSDHAVIEYPMQVELEFDRMLYSGVHRKKLVNGMSGYQAPVYDEMRRRMAAFPSPATLEDIRDLGVRWVIVHRDAYGRRWPVIAERLEGFGRELELVAELGEARVYETRGAPWLTRDDVRTIAVPSEDSWISLPSHGWTATANLNEHLAALAIDGDVTTRWNTRAQTPDDYFAVDFGSEISFGSIVLRLYSHPHGYPRGYRVEVSPDGATWETVVEVPRVHLPITAFIHPLEQRFEIVFPEVTARHLRIVQTGTDRFYAWTIHELDVRRRRIPAGTDRTTQTAAGAGGADRTTETATGKGRTTGIATGADRTTRGPAPAPPVVGRSAARRHQ